ncbi:MAG: methyltransferase domain-containing protein [Pseudomonadota bacterium]
MTDRKFLDTAYDLEDASATQSFYEDWAASYDAEIKENGYATPRRCAEALAARVPDRAAPVLDLGCGTGLGGLALRAAGFTTIDGSEPSDQMLDGARKLDGVYRDLIRTEIETPLPFAPGTYAHIFAAGVIAAQHAPPETVDAALAILPEGGCLVFSLNDHTMQDPAFPAKVDEVIANGTGTLLFREHGPHLPGIGLESTVFVLQKP